MDFLHRLVLNIKICLSRDINFIVKSICTMLYSIVDSNKGQFVKPVEFTENQKRIPLQCLDLFHLDKYQNISSGPTNRK